MNFIESVTLHNIDFCIWPTAVFQLEDDVIAKNGYYNDMKAFTKQDANNQWLYVEFSQLGFIGAYSSAVALSNGPIQFKPHYLFAYTCLPSVTYNRFSAW